MNSPGEARPSRFEGKTSRAIQDAPPGAVFVCLDHAAIGYVADLARSLGRTDLALLGPSLVMDHCRGLAREIVVDHAASLDPLTIAAIEFHNDAVRDHAARATA